MRRKWLTRLFPFLIFLLLTPWPIAYAHEYTYDTVDAGAVKITVAEASAAPNLEVFGKAIGGVEPGDLFFVDSADNPADTRVTLYLTNAEELSRSYSYMILKVSIYVQRDIDEWENLYIDTETFLTMREPGASFILPGYAKYKLTIDGGSYYCNAANTDGLAPRFYLSVNR